MRFAFSAEQQHAASELKGLLARVCPPKSVRARWEGEPDDGARWRQLVEMGLPALLVPEADGGLGGDELDLVLMLEECGRAAVPEPIVDTAWVAPGFVGGALAQRLVTGDLRVAVGEGDHPLVADADRADVLLLSTGDDAYLLPRDRVTLSDRQASVDGARALFAVEWSPTNGERVGTATELRDRAALGTAAVLLGLSRRMLDMTAEYVQVRKQFGVAVGSFQAVKHPLATALVRLSLARPVVHRAAYSFAKRDPDRGVHASMAKSFAGESALLSARVALQAHGAIGYSFEHDLHLFMKRAWALAAAFGDARAHRERIAKHLFDNQNPERS